MPDLVHCPWGWELAGDPAIPARLFAWEHFALGHHYVVMDSAERAEIVCDCGESFDDAVTL